VRVTHPLAINFPFYFPIAFHSNLSEIPKGSILKRSQNKKANSEKFAVKSKM